LNDWIRAVVVNL